MKKLHLLLSLLCLLALTACGNIRSGDAGTIPPPTSTSAATVTPAAGATAVPSAPSAAAPTATAVPASTTAPTAAPSATPVPAGPTPTPTRTPTAAAPPPAPTAIPVSDGHRADPFTLLAAYFDAISHKDYGAAAKYHVREGAGAPDPAIATKLAADYAGVSLVVPLVDPIVVYGAAAGSQYAPVPVLLIITQSNSTKRYLVGCETARHANPGNFDPPRDTGWEVYSETLAKTVSVDISQLAKACEPGASPAPLTDRSNPVNVLAALYDAINRKDYARGYGYWEQPPSGKTLAQWTAGYANTASVLVGVRPPLNIEGAAGSQYASLPIVLLATDKDSSKHAFDGCYVARRVNPAISGKPDAGWRIYSGTLNNAPGNAASATLVTTITCP
jgi:hypothetical protein